jgi:HSP20 family protein
MAENRETQPREGKGSQGSSTTSGSMADTPGRQETGMERGGDRQRPIQTGRESGRSSGVARRQSTAPYSGLGSSPYSLMRRMAEDMDRIFDTFGFRPGTTGWLSPSSGLGRDRWSGASGLEETVWSPQVETLRRGDRLVIRADLPGMNRDDVKVEVDNGVLTISGERSDENEEDSDEYYRSERSYGSFYRAIPLPEGIDENACEAKFKDGVLEVSVPMPKQEERQPKQIKVH